ncbi:uncharacterized protein LOC124934999 [Impatiens glandulifera]|uniref:uncharacterized protein LOC124934999 n=1 Tax=Impatiens glandulifera TaxID=253017 RepID=UPI001FB12335|nr:uncharacterized protein LOC124934999 [Impatiens glandulifera]
MASHLKGVKKSTMTDEMRNALCEHVRDNPSCTKKQLQQWVAEKFNLQVSQATISNTIKKSTNYLSANMERGDTRRHKAWSIDVQQKTNANCFQHCELRHVNKTTISEDVDQLSEDVQHLSLLIKELNYRDVMDAEKVIDYPGENEAATEFLNDEQIISSVMKNKKEDEAEDDSTELELVS